MRQKPSFKSILTTYSHSEILDLIKEKAELDYQETVKKFQSRLLQITTTLGISPSVSTSQTKPSKKTRTRKRAKNKQPIGEMIVNVLSSTPMSINEIKNTIQANGFKTTSKNPRQIISMELLKLRKEKKIKKAGRGMYTLASNKSSKKTRKTKK